MPLLTFLIVLVVIVVVLAVTCVKIVPQAEAAIVERLGSYLTTWNNNLLAERQWGWSANDA